MTDVDLYIAKFSPELQRRLLFIRRTALDAFGEVEEKPYYGYPTIRIGGEVVLFYGAYKEHVSICTGFEWNDLWKSLFPQFGFTQATIKFFHKEPLPEDVIRTICDLVSQSFRSGNLHQPKMP